MSDDDDEYLLPDSNDYNTDLDKDTRVEDYEDFLDVARRVQLKFTAEMAAAFSRTAGEFRRRHGIPDPQEDRVRPRERGPGDVLFDIARLQLDYLGKLADLTKAHGGEAHRILERLFAGAAPRKSGESRLNVELYVVGGEENQFEPQRRRIRFVLVNDWEPDADLSFRVGSFVDVESGLDHAGGLGALTVTSRSTGQTVPLGGSTDVTVDLDVAAAKFAPFHAYRADIDALVGSRVRRTIQVVVRSVPKPALPTLQFTLGRALQPPERIFPIVNDQDVPVTLEEVRGVGVPLLDVASHSQSSLEVSTSLAGFRKQKYELEPGDSLPFPISLTLAGRKARPSRGTYEREVGVLLRRKGGGDPFVAKRLRVRCVVGQP
jgi:hypothetical protein